MKFINNFDKNPLREKSFSLCISMVSCAPATLKWVPFEVV